MASMNSSCNDRGERNYELVKISFNQKLTKLNVSMLFVLSVLLIVILFENITYRFSLFEQK